MATASPGSPSRRDAINQQGLHLPSTVSLSYPRNSVAPTSSRISNQTASVPASPEPDQATVPRAVLHRGLEAGLIKSAAPGPCRMSAVRSPGSHRCHRA